MIALYYYENLTLREIGEVLGVTESRVSQLHTKAVLRLRSRLHERTTPTRHAGPRARSAGVGSAFGTDGRGAQACTSADRIRNVALVGHRGSGKTSLHEALLFEAGAVNRLGSVTDGTTVSDADPDEQARADVDQREPQLVRLARAQDQPASTRPASRASSPTRSARCACASRPCSSSTP